MLGFIKKIKKNLKLIIIILWGCTQSQSYQPKPRGFNKIYLPETNYKVEKINDMFSFERNLFSKISINKELGWINLSYFNNSAEVLITYKKISSSDHFGKLLGESFKLISQHQKKATSIVETDIITLSGKKAKLIDIRGEVASPFQFIVSDSTKNFIRTALYFEKTITSDSLSPVIDYIKTDMLHLLNSIHWNE